MAQEKFAPAKQVIKTRKLTLELPVYDYQAIARAAKRKRIPIREFIRMALTYAMANLEP